MFSSNNNAAVGISICKENLAWILLEERKDKQIEIKLLDTIPFYPVLNYDNLLSQESRKTILETLGQSAKVLKFKDYDCYLTLDSSLAFIVKIPIDKRLNDIEFQEHIKWEFDTLMEGENYDDYFAYSMKLYYKKPGRPTAALTYFIKKSIITFFQNLFDDLNITLNSIDIDHFSIESVCKLNYTDFVNSNSILISVKNKLIEISLIIKGEFFNYRIIALNSTSEIIEAIEKELNLIGKQINELNISRVFINAPNLKQDALNSISSLLPNRIEVINPFKKLILNKSILSFPAIKNPHLYVSPISVALRKFQK